MGGPGSGSKGAMSVKNQRTVNSMLKKKPKSGFIQTKRTKGGTFSTYELNGKRIG